MRILLGLGHAQVAHAAVGHHVGQDVGQRLRRRNHRQREMLVVLRHADVGEIFGNAVARNLAVQVFSAFQFTAILGSEVAVARQAARDLPGAVGAEVEIDADIAIANVAQRLAAIVGQDEGNDELVGHSPVVGVLHALPGVDAAPALGVAEHHRVECLFLAVPFLIAVHGIVAAADRGNLADAVLAHLLLQLFKVAGAVGGERVAPIHKAMHENAVHAVLFCHAQNRVQMILV